MIRCQICNNDVGQKGSVVEKSSYSFPDFSILYRVPEVAVVHHECSKSPEAKGKQKAVAGDSLREFDWRSRSLVVFFFSLSIIFELTQIVQSIVAKSTASLIGELAAVAILSSVVFVNIAALRKFSVLKSRLHG